MKFFLQKMKKFFSAILLSSKDTGEFKIAMYRETSNANGKYRFGFTIESKK